MKGKSTAAVTRGVLKNVKARGKRKQPDTTHHAPILEHPKARTTAPTTKAMPAPVTQTEHAGTMKTISDIKKLFGELSAVTARRDGVETEIGKRIEALGVLYARAQGTTHGFVKWASERLERTPQAIHRYLRIAANPTYLQSERERQQSRVTDWLRRTQSAYGHMDTAQKRTFNEWLAAELDKRYGSAPTQSRKGRHDQRATA